MTSDKIRPHHLARKAILYVRQSSAHQVLHNRESSALQYAMRDRLITLGWSQIETVDDDLGRSAAGRSVSGSRAWLPRSVSARSARWRRERCRAVRQGSRARQLQPVASLLPVSCAAAAAVAN
jgi:hypothetical protein